MRSYTLDQLVESMARVRNRNEQRVMELLPGIVDEFDDYTPNLLDLQDIFALTLNNLPPRYAQDGTIVLRKVVNREMISDEIRKAVNVVRSRPKHGQ